MSLRRGIIIEGHDFSANIIRESMVITYEPIKGLDDVWTEDLTLHDDLLGYRRVITVTPDVMPEATARTLIGLLRSATVNIHITDPAEESAETIACQPELPTVKQRLTHNSGAEYWQLGSLVFRERSGTVVDSE